MSLETNVSSAFTRVATEFKTLRTGLTGNNTGSLTGLTTTQKGSLVAAINELDAAIDALSSAEGGATIADGAPSGSTVWSSSKTSTEIAAATAALIDAAPGALDTLNELAAALGDDPAFATTITNQIAGKANTVHTHTASQVTDFNTAADARVNALVPSASETAQGKVELATTAEATTGTDTARAVTPAGLKAVGDTKAPLSHTHTASNITDFSTAADARVNALVPTASETAAGKVELATAAETTTGTDTTRAVHPAGLKVELDKKALLSHTHTASNITDFNTSVDARVTSGVPAATDTVAGRVELATTVEVQTGTDTTRAVTAAGLRAVTGNPETDFVAVFTAALV